MLRESTAWGCVLWWHTTFELGSDETWLSMTCSAGSHSAPNEESTEDVMALCKVTIRPSICAWIPLLPGAIYALQIKNIKFANVSNGTASV